MHEGRQPQAVSGGLHNEEEALSTVQGGGGRSTWGDIIQSGTVFIEGFHVDPL